jgi:hypothetical protein
MNSYPVKIGGEEVRFSWTQETAKRYTFRASKIGGAPRGADFANPRKVTAAIGSFLWLILPAEIHQKYDSPEELFMAIDHDDQSAQVAACLTGIFSDMSPDAEKKSTSRKSPSRKSS